MRDRLALQVSEGFVTFGIQSDKNMATALLKLGGRASGTGHKTLECDPFINPDILDIETFGICNCGLDSATNRSRSLFINELKHCECMRYLLAAHQIRNEANFARRLSMIFYQ